MSWICVCQHVNGLDVDLCEQCGAQRSAPNEFMDSSEAGGSATDGSSDAPDTWWRLPNSIYVRTEPFGADNKLRRPKCLLTSLVAHAVGSRQTPPFPLSFLDEAQWGDLLQNKADLENKAELALMLASVGETAASGMDVLPLWDPKLYAGDDGDEEGQDTGGAAVESTDLGGLVADGEPSRQERLEEEARTQLNVQSTAATTTTSAEVYRKRKRQVDDDPGEYDRAVRADGSVKRVKLPDEDDVVQLLTEQANEEGEEDADVEDDESMDIAEAASEEDPLVRLMTMFDRGHVFALALGGIDNGAQIVPQVRSCNRGAWLRMEIDLAKLALRRGSARANWWDRIEQREHMQSTSAAIALSQSSGAASGQEEIDVCLEHGNAVNKRGELAARVFVFYHARDEALTDTAWALLERIPAWFYMQVYFVTSEGGMLGLAHYSIGNGRADAFIHPTQDEIAAFERAHVALHYPEDALDQIAAETWYPDPPYAALQWLCDENDDVVTCRRFGAVGFTGAQIQLIRKYNCWIHSRLASADATTMKSDYRSWVRELRLRRVEMEVQAYQKLSKGEKLNVDEAACIERTRAALKRKVDEIQLEEQLPSERFGASAFEGFDEVANSLGLPIADGSEVWQDEGDLVRLRDAINAKYGDLQQAGVRKYKRESDRLLRWAGSVREQLAYLRKLVPVQQHARAFEALANQQPDALANAVVTELIKEKEALQSEIKGEEPDLYETLNMAGGRSYPEVDHILPKGRNGLNRYDNARLISFAQNHIYRDKVYLQTSRSETARDKAYQRCKKNYEKEAARLGEDTDLLQQHMSLVEAFRRRPDEQLLQLINGFIDTWDVKLDHRSDRPDPPDPPAAEDGSVDLNGSL